MIFTHCGKLGDFFFTLPIANWYYKTTGEKVHYVLSSDFPFFKNSMTEFSKYVNCIEKVTLVPHKIENYECGGQPYKFNPSDYGIEGKYVNLGYRHFPNKYAGFFVAEEFGFGWDCTNLFSIIPDYSLVHTKVYTNEYGLVKPRLKGNDYEELSFKDPLHVNISKMLGAKEVRVFHSGFAAICDMLIPQKLYVYASPSIMMYGRIFFVNHAPLWEKDKYILI